MIHDCGNRYIRFLANARNEHKTGYDRQRKQATVLLSVISPFPVPPYRPAVLSLPRSVFPSPYPSRSPRPSPVPFGVCSPALPVLSCRGAGRSKDWTRIAPPARVEGRGDISWRYAVSEVSFGEYRIASEPVEGDLVAGDFVILPLIKHIHAIIEDPDVPPPSSDMAMV